MTTFYFGDGSGPVPAHQHINGGGWVADTARVDSTAYVGPDALVYGNAWVFGHAGACWSARVYGNAWVFGHARVYGDTRVYGDARVFRDARVYGDALVYGDARVSGDAQVYDDAHVYGGAKVCGDAIVGGNASAYGDTFLKYGRFFTGEYHRTPFSCQIGAWTAVAHAGHVSIGCESVRCEDATDDWIDRLAKRHMASAGEVATAKSMLPYLIDQAIAYRGEQS